MIFFSAAQNDAGKKAAELLKQKGAVLIVPTETVYGLICAWEDEEARKKIYDLKHRSPTKLFAAFVPEISVAEKLCGVSLPPAAKRLAEKFMPGAITLIVPDKNGSTFGFRIPDHPFILDLLKQYNGALASTSANLSGEPPALDLPTALRTIDGAPAGAVDGGALPEDSVPSTIIQVTADGQVKIIRDGLVKTERIMAALRS
ncbi:MAG: threonylcarbamoyl-AMP synthase [Lentisphaerae bacterium]|nr:threonylcarbamoyl-AMP synthase [Lentisphaerota bacterium]